MCIPSVFSQFTSDLSVDDVFPYAPTAGDLALRKLWLKNMIEKNPSIERIRLSSMEPSDFDRELIKTLAESAKVCRYFHIPLQSGSDFILRRMKRPYSSREYAQMVENLRESMPDAALGADVMVGFPGESEIHHRESCRFIEKINFCRLHVFRYSPRPKTEAFAMPGRVDPRVKEQRWAEINRLGEKMARNYRCLFRGKTVKVLVERACLRERYVEGFMEHYIKVRAEAEADPRGWPGQIVPVKIKGEENNLLRGTVLLED